MYAEFCAGGGGGPERKRTEKFEWKELSFLHNAI
jgi:hypothetical protein